MAKIEF